MKIRLSKRGLSYLLFRARNLSVAEIGRRFKHEPVGEAVTVLRKAESLQRDSSQGAALSLDDDYVFMPSSRRDGVGVQALVRICVMFLSRRVGAAYLHLPFTELQHQFNDPVGRSLSRLDWAEKWESFLNLGQGEHAVADVAKQMGHHSLAREMVDKDRQFGKPGIPLKSHLSDFLNESSGGSVCSRGVNVFDLRFFRDSTAAKLSFDSGFVAQLQAKFAVNGYVPRRWMYSDQYLDIAIHVRRGDVWESHKAGNLRWEEKIRFVSEGYYVSLLQRLQSLFHTASKPVRFHIFSDGQATDFPQFTFVSEKDAYLEAASGKRIENIQFHLSENSLDALYHLVKAPVLVPTKSSFSFLAVLLGKSKVLYDKAIHEFYQYDLIRDYMARSSRFVLLNDLSTVSPTALCDAR